jgi:IclR family acetate operon transcriptional repressor
MNYIQRVATILKKVAESPAGLGVSELAADLGLPKSGVFRIMTDLESVGLLRADKSARRTPGELLFDLSHLVLGSLNFLELASEHLRRLSEETNETVTFSRAIGSEREYLLQVESPQLIRMSVPLGVMLPLHSGASGQALLAGFDEHQLEQFLQDTALPAVTGNTITDPAQLRERIRQVREEGFAYSQGERDPLASSIATPVIRNGRPLGAISICGPLPRMSREVAVSFLPSLLRTAREIGALGFDHQPAHAVTEEITALRSTTAPDQYTERRPK